MREGRFKSSLFIKIILPALVLIAVPNVINLFYAAYSASDALETESSSSLSRLVLEKKNEVDLVFESQFALSDAWVNDLFAVDFFRELSRTNQVDQEKAQQLSNILEERFTKANGLYENIFFTYDDKVLLDGIGGASVGYVMDRELEDYYYEQLKNPGLATGHYMYSPITGRPTIPIINSILDDQSNQVISALVIAIDVNNLTDDLVKSSEGQAMGTMILDSQGLVIAADKADLALNLNFRDQEETKGFFLEMEENGAGNGKFALNGVEYIASYMKHEQYGFYILSYLPVEQYMGKVDQLEGNITKVILFSVILSSIALFFAIRLLVKPIKVVAQTARQIASGDLTTQQVNIANNDEIGELANSFNTMLVRLQKMVEQISITSQKVAASAGEFSTASEQSSEVSRKVAETIQEVSVGTEEQSRHISYSVAQIKEITDGVKNITENAQNVTALANLAAEKADAGMATVYSSIAEIETVNENVHQVSEKIKHLGERTKEISQIVEVITQIANQTNLLALNASIEAARAGESGHGFAVVANEVRKLAEQTRESSEQIKTLIDSILDETDQTVRSMDEAVKQSAKGIEAIQSVEQTFDDIQRSVADVTAQIQAVASATQLMRSAIEQIAANMNEINDISLKTAAQTQQVSSAIEEELASADEIAASSQEMAKLAKELEALVQQFKVH